jgi:hypothetical protein
VRSVWSFDPETLAGWGNRPYNWELGAGVQREVLRNLAVDVSYFRRHYGNFLVTDNLAVTADDFTKYSITAPANAGLPGGGGYTVSGLYDINPNRFGLVRNYVTFARNYGEQFERWHGADVNVNFRPRAGVFLAGGLSSGKTSYNNCEVAAALPETLAPAVTPAFGANGANQDIYGLITQLTINTPRPTQYCSLETPFLTQVKAMGAYTIPRIDLQVSGALQNTPGQLVTAAYNVPTAVAAQSLGRPLSGNAAVATWNIIQPGTTYSGRINQLDLRIGKILRFGPTRTSVNLDIFNVFNASSVLLENINYGAFRQPQAIMPARFARVSAQIDF